MELETKAVVKMLKSAMDEDLLMEAVEYFLEDLEATDEENVMGAVAYAVREWDLSLE